MGTRTGSTVIVISDLHISAGALDDCDDELEQALIDFLGGLASRSTPVELVINGDFLDFVQAPPWEGSELSGEAKDGTALCFTEAQSLTKLDAIVAAHPQMFDAVTAFLRAKGDNRVVMLPGNHDADLFWPAVRDRLSKRILGPGSAPGQLVFHLEQVYRPSSAPDVWIEHGHQRDPVNDFNVSGKSHWSSAKPPMFPDAAGVPRLYECVGTRFLNRYINRLDAEYPMVDNVKPFSRFLSVWGASALHPGYGPLKAAAAVWGLGKFLGRQSVQRPSDLLGIQDSGNGSSAHPLAAMVARMPESERATLTKRLRDNQFEIDRPLDMFLANRENADACMDFLSEHPDLAEGLQEHGEGLLSLSGQQGTLSLSKSFLGIADEAELLQEAAVHALGESDVKTVVMGHTHETVRPRVGRRYINTGSWTRNYRVGTADGPKIRSWSMLKSKSYAEFPYQLNYVEVGPAQGASALLSTFRERVT